MESELDCVLVFMFLAGDYRVDGVDSGRGGRSKRHTNTRVNMKRCVRVK